MPYRALTLTPASAGHRLRQQHRAAGRGLWHGAPVPRQLAACAQRVPLAHPQLPGRPRRHRAGRRQAHHPRGAPPAPPPVRRAAASPCAGTRNPRRMLHQPLAACSHPLRSAAPLSVRVHASLRWRWPGGGARLRSQCACRVDHAPQPGPMHIPYVAQHVASARAAQPPSRAGVRQRIWLCARPVRRRACSQAPCSNAPLAPNRAARLRSAPSVRCLHARPASSRLLARAALCIRPIGQGQVGNVARVKGFAAQGRNPERLPVCRKRLWLLRQPRMAGACVRAQPPSRPLLAHAGVRSPWARRPAARVATLCLGAQIFPWPTDNLTGAGFDFDYDKPGAATMLATFAATHARNRLAAQLESNGGLL